MPSSPGGFHFRKAEAMDTTTWVWIIIGILVVLLIIGLIVFLGRKRRQAHVQKKRREDHDRANQIREEAHAKDLEAREREAHATRAAAEAQQAEVDAERLRREAEQRQADAQGLRRETEERARHADEIDPFAETSRDGRRDDRGRDDAGPGQTPGRH
ncbi:LPXTG cell wall anchor domain-containing protein [Arthrobacter sp. JZ12]|nr:LPXTG cell wall anchor domain-containing protein [Arthrobacter sp. JZ12]